MKKITKAKTPAKKTVAKKIAPTKKATPKTSNATKKPEVKKAQPKKIAKKIATPTKKAQPKKAPAKKAYDLEKLAKDIFENIDISALLKQHFIAKQLELGIEISLANAHAENVDFNIHKIDAEIVVYKA